MGNDPNAEIAKMMENLKEKTGKSAAEWGAIARGSGLTKHSDLVNFLKTQHGLTYGYANMVVHQLNQSAAGMADDRDGLIEQQYTGAKAALRPIYEHLLAEILKFGDDIQIAPMKAYVSLRRGKQFACIQPSTKDRVDVGIKLKGVEATDRLEAGGFNGMVSHLVKVTDIAQVDDELLAWLRAAYENA